MSFWKNLFSFHWLNRKKESYLLNTNDFTGLISPANIETPRYTHFGKNQKMLSPDFAVEWLPTLRFLTAWNYDFSYAVDNIVNLANTPFHTHIEGLSKRETFKALRYLENSTKDWIPFSVGHSSLVTTLLRQLATYGAISADPILDSRAKAIQRITFLSPYWIRFALSKEGVYSPYQNIQGTIFKEVSQNTQYNYRKLNDTYRYIAFQKDSDAPYALPPLLSAIEGTQVQRHLLDNLKLIASKFGAFGFLTANINPPKKKQGESDRSYQKRCETYLDEVAPKIKKMSAEGFGVGFKDTHEFKMQTGNVDVGNASEMMKMVELIVMAGLKQDPNLLGRQQSTTETFGRVLLAKMETQVESYQSVVADYLAFLQRLQLALAGWFPSKLEVKFEKPLIGDRLKEVQEQKAKLDNLLILYNQGIIDQETFAKEAGYETPALPSPRANSTPLNPSQKPSNAVEDGEKKITDPTGERSAETQQLQAQEEDNRKRTAFDPYSMPIVYEGTASEGFANENASAYERQVLERYRIAVNQFARRLKADLEQTNRPMAVEEIYERTLRLLLSDWNGLFTDKVQGIVSAQINRRYRRGRKDKSIFPKGFSMGVKSSFAVPEPEISIDDLRTIEFLEKFDSFYLGKFITDEDSKKRFLKFLKENYIESDREIGRNPEGIKQVQNTFKQLATLEAYKVSRIIDTSLNRIRTFGNLRYMAQANVEQYEIVEVMDKITCPWCREMNGKRFSVKTVNDRLQTLIDSDPSEEKIGELFPFATTRTVEEVKKMSDSELQEAGINSTPFHPKCRGRKVAVLS